MECQKYSSIRILPHKRCTSEINKPYNALLLKITTRNNKSIRVNILINKQLHKLDMNTRFKILLNNKKVHRE